MAAPSIPEKRKISLLRSPLPRSLETVFNEYKDIRSIDRIQVAAWIGFALALCLFILDYIRWKDGKFDVSHEHHEYNKFLFWFHLLMVLFILPALHITWRKSWIIQTRLRRGVVIWGMVVLCYGALLLHAAVIFLHRGTLTMFMGFIFTASWMFSMSHRERLLFFFSSLAIMSGFIIHKGLSSVDDVYVSFIEVFFLSLVAFFFDSFDYNMNVTAFLNQRQIEQEQATIRQLEEFKSRFFTNLTHEFRTPLTIIQGMAKEITASPGRWLKEGTQLIRQNADRLLHLVNQILDLSKIESGSMPVHMVHDNIITFLGYSLDAFKDHALARRIQLHYVPSGQILLMDFDPDKMHMIISNLLSNAVKFTPPEGNIYVSVSRRRLREADAMELSVQDTGIGIDAEHLDRIFERFYQADDEISRSGLGTGIGLSLVRELVHLHHGEIKVASQPGRGTSFTILLPLSQPGPVSSQLDSRPSVPPVTMTTLKEIDSGNHVQTKSGLPEILIIEDHPDVQLYLRVCLEDRYQLTFASDGQKGIDMAIETVPDLVICDVLMPGKDGYMVCRELTHHPATSHVPIILLSAKVDTASRISGLESGADVYMTKPFEKEELNMQVRNLLARFDDWHRRYAAKQPLPEISTDDAVAAEDEFVTRLRKLIYARLDDPELAVLDLERGVFLSRSQLHKKLKALTGLSAMQFVSHIRLTEARKRLLDSRDTVSDIAYQVGYTDPNYFTRAYGEFFRETPSETRNSLKDKN